MASFDSRFSSGQHVPPFHYGDGATLSINRTIRTQGEIWLTGLANRGSASLNPSTTARYAGALHNWIYPVLGDLNLSRVNHASLRPLVQQMFDAGFSTSTIKTYVRIVQVIVASFTDLNGEEVYPRRWHSTLLGLPGIHGGQRSAPCFSSDLVSAIVNYEKSPRERTLFILAAASGARIGELLGLEIGTHISPDCTTLRIRTRNSMREVDLHPTGFVRKLVGLHRYPLLACSRPKDTAGISGRQHKTLIDTCTLFGAILVRFWSDPLPNRAQFSPIDHD